MEAWQLCVCFRLTLNKRKTGLYVMIQSSIFMSSENTKLMKENETAMLGSDDSVGISWSKRKGWIPASSGTKSHQLVQLKYWIQQRAV